MERVRYYLRDIKHVLFSYFIKDYKPQPELDEDESEEDRKESEFKEIQKIAENNGIPKPIKRA